MLIVDPEKRFTIDQCLAHPWMTPNQPNVNDSTNGLVSGLAGLDVQRRGVVRERTLLSSINDVTVTNRVPLGNDKPDLKIYAKNPRGAAAGDNKQETRPDDARDPNEFMELGGKGDQVLFEGGNESSRYSKNDVVAAQASSSKAPAATGGKKKANGR